MGTGESTAKHLAVSTRAGGIGFYPDMLAEVVLVHGIIVRYAEQRAFNCQSGVWGAGGSTARAIADNLIATAGWGATRNLITTTFATICQAGMPNPAALYYPAPPACPAGYRFVTSRHLARSWNTCMIHEGWSGVAHTTESLCAAN